jgi:hypothetical protein
MKPAQKTKKQKPTKSGTRTTFSYINKTQFLKMKKRRKKIQESAKEDRSRLPATVRTLFLISRVCGWVCEHKRRASARGRTRAQKDRNEIIGRAACCNGSVGTRLSPSFRPSHLPYVPTYFPTYLPFKLVFLPYFTSYTYE